MAVVLKTGQPVRGVEAVAERPDGTLVPFMPYPTPLHDEFGNIVGAVNMLVDLTGRSRAEQGRQLLASIVECSDDAIVSKDLNGIISSWNPGAERLFGYTADEVVGKSITQLFPPGLIDEEWKVLSRIRAGDRIEHYEDGPPPQGWKSGRCFFMVSPEECCGQGDGGDQNSAGHHRA